MFKTEFISVKLHEITLGSVSDYLEVQSAYKTK